MYVCRYICMYVCMYIYIYNEYTYIYVSADILRVWLSGYKLLGRDLSGLEVSRSTRPGQEGPDY